MVAYTGAYIKMFTDKTGVLNFIIVKYYCSSPVKPYYSQNN